MAWTKITEELKKKVLEIYPYYSDIETCRRIGNISKFRLFKVVELVGLKKHSRKENYNLGQKLYKENSIKNHGCPHAATSVEVKEKRQKTNLKKYGSISPFGNIHVQQKSQQTLNINYAVDNPMHSEKIKNILKQSNIEKYGVEYSFQAEEIKEKIKQTNLKKYGSECFARTAEWKEKIKRTNLEKYGVENTFQAEEFKEKIKATNLEKYGYEYYSQTENYKKGLFEKFGTYHAPSKKYIYENEYFDSFPELCFYLYYIKNNTQIKHEPIELTFTFENKQYHYYPDFEVNDTLYEIKGPQFLKEDSTWQNPFDHSLDSLFEAKHQCALKNNVKILYSVDYQKYIDWFDQNNYKKEDFRPKE